MFGIDYVIIKGNYSELFSARKFIGAISMLREFDIIIFVTYPGRCH